MILARGGTEDDIRDIARAKGADLTALDVLKEEALKEFDKMFSDAIENIEWIDEKRFTEDGNPFVIETLRKFISTTIDRIAQESTEAMRDEYEPVKTILEYIASRNEQHNAVCIPKAQEALELIRSIPIKPITTKED